ncbi:MAG: DUF1572 domain-containing protein [Bacteroidetes bacterium]|nr:MAG: DUF1572 domain-containing protein [Bacteroidota bacterium]
MRQANPQAVLTHVLDREYDDQAFFAFIDQDFWRPAPEDNSIAIIVHHLSGNMKFRWTDFLTADGEKSWRNREREFEDVLQTRAELLEAWETGWACLFEALATVTPENFSTPVYIRNQAHSILEAIQRQLGHYAYHVGQIVMIGKMVRQASWQSLSIPKGQSQAFNAQKFSQGKHGGHFSEDRPAT